MFIKKWAFFHISDDSSSLLSPDIINILQNLRSDKLNISPCAVPEYWDSIFVKKKNISCDNFAFT
jgi:hypothetical protein